MTDVTNENKEIFLMGDLNCDFLKKNPVTSHMSVFMDMFNLNQLVTKATRITPTSKTLLDVILTTNSNMCVNTDVIHHSFSDHSLVQTVILSNFRKKSCNVNHGNHVTKKFRSFKNFNEDCFVNDLNGVDWNIHDSMPVNVAWDSFVDKFTNICDKHAPVKTIRFKHNSCPWLDHRDDIFNAMHERDYHHNKALHCSEGQNDHWNQYKMFRNKVNVMMRDAKREYYTNEINNSQGDMSKMWKTLKELLPNKKGNLNVFPSTSKSDMDLANDLNKHFTNIGINSASNNDSSETYGNETHVDSNFVFAEISVNEVIDELNAISANKASGLDSVCTKLIKYGSKAIAVILCKIFNMCLKQGCVPDELKVARVTPIHKSGSKDDFSNYRLEPFLFYQFVPKFLKRLFANNFICL